MLRLKFWPADAKNWLTGKDPDAGKDWRWEEKGTTEDEMVGWHHWLDGHEFVDGEGQGCLVCCSPWSCKESDTTENWATAKTSTVTYMFITRGISDHWFHTGVYHSFVYYHLICFSWYSGIQQTLFYNLSLNFNLLVSVTFSDSISTILTIFVIYLLSRVCLFCYRMYCSPPGSSAHGIFQTRILEQVTISYSRRSSQFSDWTHISCVFCSGRWVLYH